MYPMTRFLTSAPVVHSPYSQGCLWSHMASGCSSGPLIVNKFPCVTLHLFPAGQDRDCGILKVELAGVVTSWTKGAKGGKLQRSVRLPANSGWGHSGQ